MISRRTVFGLPTLLVFRGKQPDSETSELEKVRNDIRQVRDIQGSDGNWDYDDYMRGTYNGLELASSIAEDNREPEFRSATPEMKQSSVKDAMTRLRTAIQTDSDYAWSWHCNIAMPIQDEGVDPETANKAADRFMQLLFGVSQDEYEPKVQK